MSLISTLEATPNRIWAVVRLVADKGPLARADLQARIVPNSDVRNFGDLVIESMRLGLLEEVSKEVRLTSGIPAEHVKDEDWFVHFVDRSLQDASDKSGNDQVRLGLAWLLTCTPGLDLGWNEDQKPRIQQDTGEDFGLTNYSRFAMLCYWARYLGYAIGFQIGPRRYVVPDPTIAIRRSLFHVFQNDEELSAAVFVSRLADHCSVLEGGTTRAIVESKQEQKRSEGQLSPATSLALLRLDKQGAIELLHKSDANMRLLDMMEGDPKRVSHIRLRLTPNKSRRSNKSKP